MDISLRGVGSVELTGSGVSGGDGGGDRGNCFHGRSGVTCSPGFAGVSKVGYTCEQSASGDVRGLVGPFHPVDSVSEERLGASLVAGDADDEGDCVRNVDNVDNADNVDNVERHVVLKTAGGTAGAFACAGLLEVKVRNKKLMSKGQAATETLTVTRTHLSLSRPLPVCARYAQMTSLLSKMLSCDLVEVTFMPDELHWQVSVAEQLGTLDIDGRLLEEAYDQAREEVMKGDKLCPLNMLRPEDDVLVIPDLQLNDEYKDHACVAGGPNVRLFAAAWLTCLDEEGSSTGRERRNYGILYLADKAPRDPKYVKEIEEVLKEAANVVAMSVDEYKLDVIKDVLVLDRKRRLSAERPQTDQISVSTQTISNAGDEKAVGTSDDGTSISLDDGIGKMISAVDCFQGGSMLLECVVGTKFAVGWTVVHVNDSLSLQLGCDTKSMIGHGFWEYYLTDITERSAINSLVRRNLPFELSATFQNTLHPDPAVHVLEFRPAVALESNGNVTPRDVESPEPSRETSRNSSFQRRTSNRSMHVDGANVEAGSSPGLQPGNLTSKLLSSLSAGEREQNEASSYIRGSDRRSSGEVKRYYFAHLRADSIGAIGARTRTLQLSKEAPRVFKDIRLGPLIGRGAYGRVYRGNWNGNIVAVKVIASKQPIESRGNEVTVGRKRPGADGLHEAFLSTALSHPNVLHTYQYSFRNVSASSGSRGRNGRSRDGNGETRAKESPRHASGSNPESSEKLISELWLVSEFCNRGPLLTAIENGLFMIHASNVAGGNSSLPESQTNLIYILQTAQEISAAMEYLHGHDVVHGDLTGGNVLLQSSDKDGRGFQAKVVDFGLSRVCAGGSLKTSKMGCAEYMPPELISRGLLTKAGDVYAFGVILWELYMGKRAWAGVKPPDVLDLVAKGISLEYPEHTPRRLKVLGERCLSVSIEARPHFADIVHEVNTILDDTMSILRNFLGNCS